VARAGWRIALIGRRLSVLEEACEDCRQAGAQAIALSTDIARADQIRLAVDATLARFGHVDAVVNNAGIARFAPIERADLGDLELMLDAHLRGPINLIRAALPSLRSRCGCIVNISSIGGTLATPGRSLYGATKAAMNHLTRSLARELAPDVRVNAILPGPVDTGIYNNLGLSDNERDELRLSLLRATPAGRFGEPEEVARWVCHLLDDGSRWVTGALLCIDGGRSC